MELTADLPAPLVPLGGRRLVGYPTIESANFGQEVEFGHDGRSSLNYRSQTWLLDEAGNQVRPLATESGFWRPGTGGDLEVLLSHPTGYVKIYVGEVEGPRVRLETPIWWLVHPPPRSTPRRPACTAWSRAT